MNHWWFLAACVLAPYAAAQSSTGTAFAVAPQFLVTNQHVVNGCSTVSVLTSEGPKAATVVSVEASTDLALLRVLGLRGAIASLRSPPIIALGEPITVFGFPLVGTLSSSGNFTGGLVSALQGLRNSVGGIQITAPVQPGNSGGPVMDAAGLIVGVVQAKLDAYRAAMATGDIPQNVNFAVSLDVLTDFLDTNQVPFRSSPRAPALDTAQVAKFAQQFTYRVECNKPGPAPSRPTAGLCQDPYRASTWTNCAGSLVHANGEKYVGGFKNGEFNGQGTYTFPGGQKYVGEFKDHKRSGQGTLSYPNGEKYVGEFSDGEFNGRGIYSWPNGQKYAGDFKSATRHGQGTLTGPQGNLIYTGRWVNDRPAN